MSFIIGFSRAKSPWKLGSKVIQIVEKRPFSHTYIQYQCPVSHYQMITQASHGFINEMNLDEFKIDNLIVKQYRLNCSKDEFLNIFNFNRKNLGKKYSRIQLFVIGFMKLIRSKKPIYVDGNDKDICSEWVAKLARFTGYLTGVPDILDTFTPSDLENLLSELAVKFPSKIEVICG